MGWIGFWFNGVSRKRAIDNVSTCLPYESPQDHKKIARKGFQHMVLLAVDLLRLPETNAEAIQRINVRNKHYVVEALKEGNGVVIISAHFGNICMLPPAFDGLSDHPAYISRRSARRVGWFSVKPVPITIVASSQEQPSMRLRVLLRTRSSWPTF